jgi:hypothetical protein
MDYSGVMQLPLKTFWMMSNNIDRIMARSDMRAFGTAAAAQSTPEYVESYHRRLNAEAGTVVKTKAESPLDAKRDEDGFGFLKRLSSATTG